MKCAALEDAPYFAGGQLVEEALPSLVVRGFGRLAEGTDPAGRTRARGSAWEIRPAWEFWQVVLPDGIVLVNLSFALACRAVARLIITGL